MHGSWYETSHVPQFHIRTSTKQKKTKASSPCCPVDFLLNKQRGRDPEEMTGLCFTLPARPQAHIRGDRCQRKCRFESDSLCWCGHVLSWSHISDPGFLPEMLLVELKQLQKQSRGFQCNKPLLTVRVPVGPVLWGGTMLPQLSTSSDLCHSSVWFVFPWSYSLSAVCYRQIY